MGSHVFLFFAFATGGGAMDLPVWYVNVSFGVLIVVAIFCYGTD